MPTEIQERNRIENEHILENAKHLGKSHLAHYIIGCIDAIVNYTSIMNDHERVEAIRSILRDRDVIEDMDDVPWRVE